VQRGAKALKLVDQGRGIGDVAARLRLSPGRVAYLVAVTRDRRDVRSHKQRPLLADAQGFIALDVARDPDLTRAEIARRMDPPMHPADFDRTFGYARSGRRPGRFVSVEMGTRLMLALGRDPHELDGC
jgi:hypothetical protein